MIMHESRIRPMAPPIEIGWAVMDERSASPIGRWHEAQPAHIPRNFREMARDSETRRSQPRPQSGVEILKFADLCEARSISVAPASQPCRLHDADHGSFGGGLGI